MELEIALKWLLSLFFAILCFIIAPFIGTLFLDSHGWSHKAVGAFHLILLIFGVLSLEQQKDATFALLYDILISCSGTILTLTAARSFPHRHVKNRVGQSGTLVKKAIVTQAEMIEHSFYQLLNLVQCVYLSIVTSFSPFYRFTALCVVTSPWLGRSRFPVHSFSQNWKQSKDKSQFSTENILYMIKKSQYLFYKHFVFHGMNLTACVSPARVSTTSEAWRLFWICLHTSYVMEFFLQSLVKRRVISQATMISMNRLLMAVSSFAAIKAIALVMIWYLGMMSLSLNIINRHHDFVNTALLGVIGLGAVQRLQSQ